MKQKQIEFKNMEVKQIEYKPLIFRLYKINQYNNEIFKSQIKELDSLEYKDLTPIIK